jgi:ubiquinone/menaquinone biosynthesis C-methylase UbiE
LKQAAKQQVLTSQNRKLKTGTVSSKTIQNKKRLNLICEDIYNMSEPEKPFDLIFMRDVIEHIHNQEKFMHFVKRFLSPGGFFFLAFPPWQNPFGGHQQICQNRILAKTPWIHLLPRKLYSALLKAGGEPQARIEALLEIKETGLSLERFEKILKKEHFEIVRKDFFFFNPNYEVKFGLTPGKHPGFYGNYAGFAIFSPHRPITLLPGRHTSNLFNAPASLRGLTSYSLSKSEISISLCFHQQDRYKQCRYSDGHLPYRLSSRLHPPDLNTP